MARVSLFFKIFSAWIMSIFTAIGGVFGMTVPANNAAMMAHRGYSFMYPENTALAFTEAAKHGAEGVETDLRITKDGVYVLSHDAEVTFRDGSKLTVADSTYEELTAKPLRNLKTFDEVYLCSYESFLEIMKEYDLEFYIEFKVAATEELINDVFSIAQEKYDISKCIYESPRIDDLIMARKLFPAMPMMFVISSADADYSKCFEYNISVDVKYGIISEELVEQFHAKGLKVGSWTCDDPFTIAYSNSLGVDYIESNVFCE